MFSDLERELRQMGYNVSDFTDSKKQYTEDIFASLPDDKVEWTQKVRRLQGRPFSFENRPYLLPLYRDPGKEICIVKPRQMEITEFAANWLLYHLTKNPGTVGLYLTDRQIHVSAFSKLRLQSWAIATSPMLQQLANKCHRVSWQSFKNESHLFMHSAWDDFEAARSYPADFVVVDEIQSTNGEAMPVIEETLSKSRYGYILKIGTGSITDDYWYKTWHRGTQLEWNFDTQQWVAKNPEATISSYHFTQYMASWISPEKIEEKKRDYTPRRFANEIEGNWYEGQQKPLLEKDIRELFNKNDDFKSPEDSGHWPIYIGIDWGGGTQAFTVVWIWELIHREFRIFRVLNIIKIDDPSTEAQADQVIELIQKYNPKRVVVDAGGGARQIEKLYKKFSSLVYRCVYSPDSIEPCRVSASKLCLLIDRTWAIETMIDLIKRKHTTSDHLVPRIWIPYMKPEKVDWIIEHFTCIEAETTFSRRMSTVSYVHSPQSNDDALHASIYAYLAYLIDKENTIWKSV